MRQKEEGLNKIIAKLRTPLQYVMVCNDNIKHYPYKVLKKLFDLNFFFKLIKKKIIYYLKFYNDYQNEHNLKIVRLRSMFEYRVPVTPVNIEFHVYNSIPFMQMSYVKPRMCVQN